MRMKNAKKLADLIAEESSHLVEGWDDLQNELDDD